MLDYVNMIPPNAAANRVRPCAFAMGRVGAEIILLAQALRACGMLSREELPDTDQIFHLRKR
jgi:hypothetical protein